MKKSCPTSPHNAGFILPMTLLFLLIVGISLSGVFGYTNYVTRSMARSSSETICRLAAQSVVEEAKQEIYKQFSDYYKKEKYLFSASLDTFFTTTTESNAVGPAGYSTTYPTAGVTRNGCTVKVTFSASDVTNNDSLRQDLVIRAQATTTTPLGQKVSRTIEETAAFVLAQSEVFNYAYFINNKGWNIGGGSIINGDVRANGNFQLDEESVVNGAIYAARNEERKDHGDIYGGTGIALSNTAYLGKYDVRARPLNHYTNDKNTEADDVSWGMGYDHSLRNDASRDYGTYAQSEPLNMPYLGDLKGYIDLAKGKVYTGGNKETPKIDKVFTTEMAGPSGNKSNPDAGCVRLLGTAEKPIEIEGTVVVAGDVLIQGYIKGQGAIYAGRNIHILGNLIYLNPPQWSVNSNMTETELNAQAKENASKDLLVLAAKGNVVIGNYADTTWKAATEAFLNGYRPDIIKPYQCDASDADIGYPKNFNGIYGAKDEGWRLSLKTTTGTYEPKRDRCYYQSSVGEDIIDEFAQQRVSTIDAVIYNNHAIIGQLGNNVVFNGAVICRDEVLIYGDGDDDSTNDSIKFNWDIRLGSRSRDNLYLRNRGINPNNIVHMPLAPKSAQLVRWCEYLK